jgi:hypothetical protein
MQRIFLYMLFMCSSNAISCSSAPEEFYVGPNRMYWLSEGVVLAKAVKYLPSKNPEAWVSENEFEFEVVEIFPGPLNSFPKGKKKFRIMGVPAKGKSTDFKSHTDLSFWGDSFSGNSIMPGDCGAYGLFEIGKEYLIFMGLTHPKAYELIESSDDRWLELVKYMVKSNQSED